MESSIQVNRERLIQDFMELVQIDSHSRDERAMVDALKARLEPYGVEIVEDDTASKVDGNAGNLIVRIAGDASKPTILFTCHMDTVQPGKGIRPQRLEDRITSDGTTILGSDDKAGVAGLVEMVRVLKEQQLSHGPIIIVFTIGEEVGLLGARNLDAKYITEAAMGFAFDSNGPIGHVVTQAPTQARIEATIHGKTAHAGVNPEAGISAISVASRAISRMKLGRIEADTTANIGMINGGVATNIVPEKATIVAEARSLVQAKLDAQIDHMQESFESAAQEMGARVEFQARTMYPAYAHDSEAPVVQTALKAVALIGGEASTMSSGGGSDANVFNGLGVPTVNMAVGYEKIHTTEEFIRLNDLDKAARLMVAVTQSV